MAKNRTFLRILSICAVLCGVGVLAWALLVPLRARREAQELVTQARDVLSPPVKGLNDLDDVDCDRAAQLLRRAVDLAPSNGAARRELALAEGCSSLRRGDLILAEGGLRSASRRLPNDARPERWLGALALAQNRPEAGLRHFRRAHELDADDLASRIGMADALAELDRPEQALEALEAIESGGSRLGLIETRRGMVYEALGREADARQAYDRAMELSPTMPEPRNNLAALEREAGNLDRAWRLQSEAVELSPDDPVLLLNAGLLAILVGRDTEALQLLRHAAELDRESADPSRALADQLLVSGEVDEALSVLGRATELFPRDAALQNSLGNALAAAGRAREAQAAYRSAIQIAPRLPQPHNGLAALLLAEDDLDGAEAALEEALRLSPADRQSRRNLSELYRRRGDLERAGEEQRVAQALRR